MKSTPRSGFTSKIGAVAAKAAKPRKLRRVNCRTIVMRDSWHCADDAPRVRTARNRLTRSGNESGDSGTQRKADPGKTKRKTQDGCRQDIRPGRSQNQVQNQKTNFSPNWINLVLVHG